MQQLSQTQAVDTAIRSRMSVRAFTPQAVARTDIEAILEVASRAPSGTNCQPWRVYVLQGASRDSLVDQVCAAHEALRADPALAERYREEYDYYPEKWVSPYIDRLGPLRIAGDWQRRQGQDARPAPAQLPVF